MKKIIRLTESDLTRIVKKIILESKPNVGIYIEGDSNEGGNRPAYHVFKITQDLGNNSYNGTLINSPMFANYNYFPLISKFKIQITDWGTEKSKCVVYAGGKLGTVTLNGCQKSTDY